MSERRIALLGGEGPRRRECRLRILCQTHRRGLRSRHGRRETSVTAFIARKERWVLRGSVNVEVFIKQMHAAGRLSAV